MNMLSSFTWVDGIILAVVAAVIFLVIFFGFIRKGKKSGCKGCPYAKNCSPDACDCNGKHSTHAPKQNNTASEKPDPSDNSSSISEK